MVREINVGLVGLGTIGSGVVEILQTNSKLIEKRTGVKINLVAVCDKFTERAKQLKVNDICVSDYKLLLKNKKINVIVELIGGYEPARTIIMDAIKAKKHVVTANKAVLAKHGYEIFSSAQKNKVNVLFEASVGGCIPIIRTIEESFSSDNINCIYGILNGTTNFILTRMNEGMSYEVALKKAQELGFAERDPTFDVEGKDAAQKMFLLASLAFDAKFASEPFTCGITNLTKKDMDYAKELGYSIKLLAIAKKENGEVELRIQPSMVPKSSLFYGVNNEVNAVLLSGKQTGEIFLSGKGAGKLPTATVVVTDIIELASRTRVAQRFFQNAKIKPLSNTISKYYFRVGLLDQPGGLAAVAKIFAEEKISISGCEQKEISGEIVPVVFITHKATQGQMDAAVKKCNALACVKDKVVIIRIEDLK
ncbi:MAG: homoserine dehydrogenase [archaeon]|jgi:homoserine dehydrogenase